VRRRRQVYIAPDAILIRPFIPPAASHPQYAQAEQRIYLSATLGEGGELERGPAGVLPTPYGERLLQHADAILAHGGQLRRELGGVQKGTLGHIAVGAPVSARP
jgi:hypothetical protein